MPRSFSDSEKAFIRERLLHIAAECLALYGVRKTTVDEIVRRAGIPKGTFYLFYESKEALIFDVILQFNTDIQTQLIAAASGMPEKPDAEQLTQLIFDLYQSMDGSFLLKLVDNGELEFLMQKAPPDFVQANAMDDEAMVGRLMALLPKMDARKTQLYSAALRGAFLLMMHKDQIAYDRFDDMLHLMVRGIVLQMFGA